MAVKAGEKRRTKGQGKKTGEAAPKPKRGRPKKETAPVAKKRGRPRKQPVEKAVATKPHHEEPKVIEVIKRTIVQLAILGERP